MRKEAVVRKIEEDIERLTSLEQLKLAERIIRQLKKGRGIAEKEREMKGL